MVSWSGATKSIRILGTGYEIGLLRSHDAGAGEDGHENGEHQPDPRDRLRHASGVRKIVWQPEVVDARGCTPAAASDPAGTGPEAVQVPALLPAGDCSRSVGSGGRHDP